MLHNCDAVIWFGRTTTRETVGGTDDASAATDLHPSQLLSVGTIHPHVAHVGLNALQHHAVDAAAARHATSRTSHVTRSSRKRITRYPQLSQARHTSPAALTSTSHVTRSSRKSPIPKRIRTLEVADTLQVCVHKLALQRDDFDGRCVSPAHLQLAPSEAPKREARRPFFHLDGRVSADGWRFLKSFDRKEQEVQPGADNTSLHDHRCTRGDAHLRGTSQRELKPLPWADVEAHHWQFAGAIQQLA
jgi:hypothetical protein